MEGMIGSATTDAPSVLTTAQACELLQFERHALHALCHARKNPLPHLRIGRIYRFERDAVLDWARRNASRAVMEAAARRPSVLRGKGLRF